ncbi:hypothetical protein UFOVP716_3 [uncultured Caudovirales phage]|uniref:Uncharacterized protein n=1 Tax=uncultured Caudovirales phage TaxID=2100421 RepID=A0A6J5NR41_9CAUD|nr:hypothetical protein UFOVP716_3 [uncultured Caudovirales phage]
MANEKIGFDQTELRKVFAALKAMDEGATEEAKRQSGALAEYARAEVISSSQSLKNNKVSSRIAQGSRVKKSSKIGEITYGFASQKFSGGATTKDIWGGTEFGSNKFKQFPVWSGREGRGSRGWFIYPTLRKIQPEIVARWTQAFEKILKEW